MSGGAGEWFGGSCPITYESTGWSGNQVMFRHQSHTGQPSKPSAAESEQETKRAEGQPALLPRPKRMMRLDEK